jgi:hypothetical protein
MNFKSINGKKIKDNKLVFTHPTLLLDSNTRTIAVYEVSADEVCRIDLISEKFFNSPDYSEYILKYNNISNPFSINEGDVLNIPDIKYSLVNFKPVKSVGTGLEESEPSVRDQFINSKRLTVKDKKRIEYLQKKADQKSNGSKQILPPNLLKDGDKNIDINGDTIII